MCIRDSSEDVWQHELVPRPGGAWLLVVETDHVTATALAGDGTPLGAPWIGARNLPTDHVAAAPWRDGFAIAEFAHVGDEHGTRVPCSSPTCANSAMAKPSRHGAAAT